MVLLSLQLNSSALGEMRWPLLGCLADQPAHSYFYYLNWKILTFWGSYIWGHNNVLHPPALIFAGAATSAGLVPAPAPGKAGLQCWC